jgi:hypothetical protein
VKENTWKTSVGGRIILKWIFKQRDGACTGLIWLRIGTDGGLFYRYNVAFPITVDSTVFCVYSLTEDFYYYQPKHVACYNLSVNEPMFL